MSPLVKTNLILALNTVFYFDYYVGWKVRCAEYFPYSTYFEGRHCSTLATNKDSKQAHAENGSIEFPPSNGKVETLDALKNLAI